MASLTFVVEVVIPTFMIIFQLSNTVETGWNKLHIDMKMGRIHAVFNLNPRSGFRVY